ncbi:helix-turn-helix domain-containing protein [Breznakiella homolactica]|uniref:AraC family transcriptional regulator n=1 Tax=Breznakiella homolactica TaxID=2798577 RepID=A0A7T7XMG1_9SPIR|nr:helix-turn-helix domain-containing protein [Breznakiella homolactica]QQO09076.1 AraC family transcriptional regulator [Breznakiella homolactica]
MTGFDYIIAAIELFENSLRRESPAHPVSSVSVWASKVGYSSHHFTRLFSEITGMGAREYITGRRLSEAARRITGSDTPLAVTAAELGYADYETFSRSFKAYFGVNPKTYRDGTPGSVPILERAEPRRQNPGAFLEPPEPDIIEEDKHCLTGMAFFMDDGTPSFHKPWRIFSSVEHLVRDPLQPLRYYQFSSWPSGTEELGGQPILCAMETRETSGQETFLYTRIIPPSRYIRFVHRADISEIRKTYAYIYGVYLSEAHIAPGESWEFQRYGNPGDPLEILIPLETRN